MISQRKLGAGVWDVRLDERQFRIIRFGYYWMAYEQTGGVDRYLAGFPTKQRAVEWLDTTQHREPMTTVIVLTE